MAEKIIRFLFVPVNYNSYDSLRDYLKSLKTAIEYATGQIQVSVYIADNSTIVENFDVSQFNFDTCRICKFDNLGYFGGAFNIINNINGLTEYNFAVISNVDVLIGKSFFNNVPAYSDKKDIGWIAPQIWSRQETRDRNPKIKIRYTDSKIKFIRLLWRYHILHKIYTRTLYKRKKIGAETNSTRQYIYAGHGSFIILTKAFFNVYNSLHYPIFLFGEEIFLGELCRKAGLKVIYDPDIKIEDIDHVSTSKMKSNFYYKCNLEAIDYIIKTFYE